MNRFPEKQTLHPQTSDCKSPFQSSLLQSLHQAQDTIKDLSKHAHEQQLQIQSLRVGQQRTKGKELMPILRDCQKLIQESSNSKAFQDIKNKLESQQREKFLQMEKSFESKRQEEIAKVRSQSKKMIQQYDKQIDKLRAENKELKALKMDKLTNQTLENTNQQLRKIIKTLQDTIKKQQEEKSKDVQNYTAQIKKMKSNLDLIEKQAANKLKEQQELKKQTQMSTNEDLLNSAICLRAFDCIKQFDKVADSPKIKAQIKQFLSFINIDRSRSQNLKQLYQKNQIQTKFKTIIDQFVAQYRSFKNEKVHEKSDFQERKRNLDQQLKTLGIEKTKVEQQSKKMREAISQLQKDSARQNEEINKKQEKIKRLQQDLNAAQATNQELEKKKSGLQKQNEKLNNQIRQLQAARLAADKAAKAAADASEKSAKSKEDALRAEIDKLKSKLKEAEKQINQLTVNKKQLEKDKESLGKDKENLIRDIAERDKKIRSLQRQLQSLKIELAKALSKIKQLQKQIMNRTNDYNSLKGQMGVLSRKLQETQSQLVETRKIAQGFKYLSSFLPEISYFINREKLEFNLERPEESIKELLKWFKARYNEAKFFRDSEIVERQSIEFLTREIQSFTSSIISDIKLLYRYDPRNNTSFHHYIDGKENLLVLFKLGTNSIVGGFSCFPMEKLDRERARQIGFGKGFIFNLTNLQVFPLRKDPKMSVLTFDDYFFIFGNSELRLKPSEKKFFTNFGVANSTFDNMGISRQQFIQKEGNEVECMQFECYQVKFRM